MEPPRSYRLAEFYRRLRAAPAASTWNEAYDLLCATLDEVEDELTSIPRIPEHWQTDGRLYPPQMDNLRDVPDFPRVKRFRSRGHNTFIGENGAIEIQDAASKTVVFAKSGADGGAVWDN